MPEAVNSQSKMNQRNTLPKTSPLLPDPIKPASSPQRGQTSLQYRKPISHAKRIERTVREIKWAEKIVLRPLKGEEGIIHPRLPFQACRHATYCILGNMYQLNTVCFSEKREKE